MFKNENRVRNLINKQRKGKVRSCTVRGIRENEEELCRFTEVRKAQEKMSFLMKEEAY